MAHVERYFSLNIPGYPALSLIGTNLFNLKLFNWLESTEALRPQIHMAQQTVSAFPLRIRGSLAVFSSYSWTWNWKNNEFLTLWGNQLSPKTDTVRFKPSHQKFFQTWQNILVYNIKQRFQTQELPYLFIHTACKNGGDDVGMWCWLYFFTVQIARSLFLLVSESLLWSVIQPDRGHKTRG